MAIGIDAALAEAMPETQHRHIRGVLKHWCQMPRYLKALKSGADRHGLNGVTGVVEEEESAVAKRKWDEAQKHFRAKQEVRLRNEEAQAQARKARAEKLKAQEEAKRKAEAAATQPAPTEKPKLSVKATGKPAPVITVKKKRVVVPPAE